MKEAKDKIVSLEDLQVAYNAHNSRLVSLEQGGNSGKSAYQYAVDGGYTGTEEEFATKMATDMKMSVHITGSGTTESPYVCDTTFSDMYDAYYNGYEITATFTGTYTGTYYFDLQFLLTQEPKPAFKFSSGMLYDTIIVLDINELENVSLYTKNLYSDESLRIHGAFADSFQTGYRLNILENTHPDWQENNQTQLNYIENRPFYEIINQEDIITQQTKTFAYSSSGYCSTHITEQKYVTSGTNCKVFWDGDIYDVISKSERYPCFGDKNFIEYPFYFLLDVSESSGEIYGYNIYSNDTSDTEHTFRIYTETSDITCIDEKFIPNSIKDYTNLQNKPIFLLSSLITKEFSSTTASVDLYGLFGKQNQVISVHDDTTYKMIQLKYNSLVFCIVKSDFSIKVNTFTDSQNFEIVVTNNIRNYSITVTNGEISEENSSAYVLSENVLVKGNNAEYIPTTDYSPATKKYVDDLISSVISFNDSGELVVTIDGISKTFVPS